MSPRALRLGAPAKINLFLRVLAREESGFHDLETLYAAVDLQDQVRVELRDGPGVELETASRWKLGPPEENLVFRAARRLLGELGESPGVRIFLEKRIPPGTGLGGGSSDAAATLKALNLLLGSPVGQEALVRIGGELGADVSFFLAPAPLALAWSRGHRLLVLDPLPERAILLAIPDTPVDTAGAYHELARRRAARGTSAPPAGILDRSSLGTWERLASLAENDFETSVFAARPELSDLKQALEDTRATFSLLSGSGSALFAVYVGPTMAQEAREVLAEDFPGVRFQVTRTLRSFPSPGPR